MGKAAGTVVAVFAAGSAAMTLFWSVLGAWAEPAALGLVGALLVASSQVLGAKVATSAAQQPARS